MALRALLLRNKLEVAQKSLEALREKDADFEKREAELETAIEEVTDETSEEDRAVIEKEVEDFEAEKENHEAEKKKLEDEIEKIEGELAEEEKRSSAAVKTPETKRDGGKVEMVNRTKFFNMSIQERDAFFADETVKNFLTEVRTCMKEKRALSNAGLIIPEVMLGLIKERVEETSKLLKRVNARSVAGKSRQNVMGAIPEAIWTEMCAKLNEMDLEFHDVEVDGYKVGGFFAVCNATLEDNDVNLATEIINAIGKAIGKALDKAIVYGKGTKMPLGFVTRLAQTEKPAGYSDTAIEWVDLSKTHVLTGTGATENKLFQEIALRAGILNDEYTEGDITWIMNKATHMKVVAESMGKNANAAIVAGMNNTMPIIGGEIVDLSFMKDGDIAFGYLDVYLLAERAGTTLGQSEHCKFLEDQTVFKGTARYDGAPVIPDAFGIFSITTTAPTTAVEFAADKANATS